jgi:hypothetical protein
LAQQALNAVGTSMNRANPAEGDSGFELAGVDRPQQAAFEITTVPGTTLINPAMIAAQCRAGLGESEFSPPGGDGNSPGSHPGRFISRLQHHIAEQNAVAANAAGEAERFGFGMGRGHLGSDVAFEVVDEIVHGDDCGPVRSAAGAAHESQPAMKAIGTIRIQIFKNDPLSFFGALFRLLPCKTLYLIIPASRAKVQKHFR